MDAVQALKQVFILKDVPDSVLEIVARAAEEISVSAGETIIGPTEAPNALFIIKSGTVRVQPEGGKTPPVMFGTGETIGEMQLIDGSPAGGTATAVERADLMVIRAGKLAGMLAGNHEAGHVLYRAIARSLAFRLRRAVGMIAFSKDRS
jgi:CRP-like cAMP-binding protein